MQEDWTHATVLDHGFVKLHDAMPHWERVCADSRGLAPADARIVEAARVSFADFRQELAAAGVGQADASRTQEQDERLIRYLIVHGHNTPLEQVRLTFVCKMPIFVARQWVRHRTASINEVSARYTKLPEEYYLPAGDRWQAQSTSNKQGSGAVLEEDTVATCASILEASYAQSYRAYEQLLEQGVAREIARLALPMGVYTAWYWTTDLHNFFGFCRERLHPHAQYELRQYAKAMFTMVARIAPVAARTFVELYGSALELPGLIGEVPGALRGLVVT